MVGIDGCSSDVSNSDFAFEVADRFFVQRRIEMRLNHLFHGARRVAQISVLRQVNCAHAAAADAAHNLVAGIQNAARIKLLDGGLMAAGGSLLDVCLTGS